MRRAFFAVPGDLAAPTGGYAYARRLLALMPDEGVDLHHVALPGGFPHPDAADLAQTRRILSALPQRSVLLVDGLAYGAMPADLVAALRHRIVALVHHPLHREEGMSAAEAVRLKQSEGAALHLAHGIVAASAFTRHLLESDFGLPAVRITVAEPGTDPAPRASGSSGARTGILAIGSVIPRKGFDLLVSALAGLTAYDWRLTIAGALDRAPAHVAELRRMIAAAGLQERIRLLGAIPEAEVARLYAGADLVVSPALFEGYGMVLTEAIARGLPLIASTGGAAAWTVPDDAALKVPPGDVPALTEALRRMLADPALRAHYAEAAWAVAGRLPRWQDTAARVAGALRIQASPLASRPLSPI